jgi:hypothetical protein
MTKVEFEKLTLKMTNSELLELVRLQNNVEQSLDDIEFATQYQSSDVLSLSALNDIVVMQRYTLRVYMERIIQKYNQ